MIIPGVCCLSGLTPLEEGRWPGCGSLLRDRVSQAWKAQVHGEGQADIHGQGQA